jgi:hypothetical protein
LDGFIYYLNFYLQFFRIEPLPSDPSSLPKYPPSKELDAKMRDQEARRYVTSNINHNILRENLILYNFH